MDEELENNYNTSYIVIQEIDTMVTKSITVLGEFENEEEAKEFIKYYKTIQKPVSGYIKYRISLFYRK